MPLVVAERNFIGDQEAARLAYVSLHTADPTTTGSSEASGGSPGYVRKQITFPATASGTASAASVTFDVPAGTYTHFGLWSAATAGTFRGGNALAANQTLSSQGQIVVTVTLNVTAS